MIGALSMLALTLGGGAILLSIVGWVPTDGGREHPSSARWTHPGGSALPVDSSPASTDQRQPKLKHQDPSSTA